MTRSPYRLKADPYSSHPVILRHLEDGQGEKLLDVGRLLSQRGFARWRGGKL